MQRIWRILAMVAVASALGLAWNAASGRGLALNRNAFLKEGDAVEEIPPAEARRRLDKGFLFLDARMRMSYDHQHIPGALPLPLDEFDAAFAKLEPRLRSTFDIVVYCASSACDASHETARMLKQRGIHVAILQGGWQDWTDAGYPVKSGAEP